MTKVMGMIAASGIALSAMVGSVSAASMSDMMQCSSACSMEYMQCVKDANKLASSPKEGLHQIKMNAMMSTECGKASMACQSSCK